MKNDRAYLRRLLTDKSEPRKVVQMVSDKDWGEATCVLMGYDDASVAPEYHRSYSMMFSQTHIKIEVVSYGRTLAADEHAISCDEFASLKNLLRGQRIRKVQKQDSGMTGGSGGYLSLMKGGELLFSAYIYGNYRVIDGDLSFDGFLFESAYSTFPWLEAKIEELVKRSCTLNE